MKNEDRQDLLRHQQTAAEIELSTIPIYLYTYYSINRLPSIPTGVAGDRAEKLLTFANKAGGIIMSVAVEEMLHLSLASNILRALGGSPALAGKSPRSYPTNLPHHKAGFSMGLSPLSAEQLQRFLGIEKPEAAGASPQGDNWDTIGQFYDYIREKIVATTTDADFTHDDTQLGPGNGYDPPNNVDTIYPRTAAYPPAGGARVAVYPNARDSGQLIVVRDKATALSAVNTISHQGEGYLLDPTHKYDDKSRAEETHYFKFLELFKEIQGYSPAEQSASSTPSPRTPPPRANRQSSAP